MHPPTNHGGCLIIGGDVFADKILIGRIAIRIAACVRKFVVQKS